MNTLFRYLLRQNLGLMIVCMGLGLVIYLLSDMFDRLDEFIEAGLGIATILKYFLNKIPLIISQILPAVFLVAMVVQLGVMEKERELLALQAGGLSYGRLAVFFVLYAIVWSLLQLGFSQYFGVKGEQVSTTIWKQDVISVGTAGENVQDVWFREGNFIVHFGQASPVTNAGTSVQIYELKNDRIAIHAILNAPRFSVKKGQWWFENATVMIPDRYETTTNVNGSVAIKQTIEAFKVVDPKAKPQHLPLWQLGDAIKALEKSGSNVEVLKTVWHTKWSYAFSILAMAFLALAVSSFRKNIYCNVVVSLVLTFVFYGLLVLGGTMGEKGILPAFAGAWLGNAVFIIAASSRLLWVTSRS